MPYSEKIRGLYVAYHEAREVMRLDPYKNTPAEKALHTRRFNKLHAACEAEGLNTLQVVQELYEESRDKRPIRVEL